MGNRFTVTCGACDQETEFRRDAVPGADVWLQCDACGALFIATLPGKSSRRAARSTAGAIHEAIFDVFADMKPRLTVRQLYYALTMRGVVPKTEAGYRTTQYYLARLRRAGVLPYGWIAENTRWAIHPTTYTGLGSALDIWHDAYRRDLWARQQAYVEVWIEKDALAGVVSPIAAEYDVPLCAARGFSSITFTYDAAEALRSIGKPAYVYHFGDHAPNGVAAAYKIRDALQDHGAAIHFERVAITEEQIERYHLPTWPTKRADPRSRSWGSRLSVELDALPAPILPELVRSCILRHIDGAELQRTREAEELEREALSQMRDYFVSVRN